MTCKNCGEPIQDGYSFCMNCGTACDTVPVDNTSVVPVQDNTPVQAPVSQEPMNAIVNPKGNNNKMMFIIIGIIVAVVVIAVVVILLVTGKSDKESKNSNSSSNSSNSNISNTNTNNSNIDTNTNTNSSSNITNSNTNSNNIGPDDEIINGSTKFGDYTITVPSNYEAYITRWSFLGDIVSITNPTTKTQYEIEFAEKSYQYYKEHEEETKKDLESGIYTIEKIEYKTYNGKEYMIMSQKYNSIYTMVAFVAINDKDTLLITGTEYYFTENYDIFNDISSIISSIK